MNATNSATKNHPIGFLYLLPSLSIFLVFWLIPLVMVGGFSFFHFEYGLHPTWVGVAQYTSLFQSGLFWQSIRVTFTFSIAVVLGGTVISLLFATLLASGLKGQGIFRSLFFVPYVMPVVATSAVWLWMYQPNNGIIDEILGVFGLNRQIGWVNTPHLALVSLIVYTVWLSFGFTTLLFMAGMTNIPKELTEAAAVDGANNWRAFWHVTWPLLSPTTFFVLVVNLINAFQAFTQIYALTRGGPVNGTTTLTYFIYETAFNYFHFGAASAGAVIFFLLIVTLTGIQFLISRRAVYYGA